MKRLDDAPLDCSGAFLWRSPDMASFEDVRRYQLHLAASGVGVPTINQPSRRCGSSSGSRSIVGHTHVVHEPRKLFRKHTHDAAGARPRLTARCSSYSFRLIKQSVASQRASAQVLF